MLAACSDSPRPHLAERLDAGADDVRGGVVHAEEDRVVVGAQAVRGVVRRCGSLAGPLTASISAGSCTVAIRSSLAIGAGTTRSRSPDDAELVGEPHRQVDPQRRHRVVGPKSYSVRLGSKTTVAGPEHWTDDWACDGRYRYAGAVLTTVPLQWWPA